MSLSGPACSVSVVEPSGEAVVVLMRWDPKKRTKWRKPVSTTGLVRGEKPNAVLVANGLLKRR
jgi:hypothetical protein